MLRKDELVFSFAPRLDLRNTRENIQTHDSVGGKYLWFSRWCENKQQRLHKGSQNIYLSFSLRERKTAADDDVAACLSSGKGESRRNRKYFWEQHSIVEREKIERDWITWHREIGLNLCCCLKRWAEAPKGFHRQSFIIYFSPFQRIASPCSKM